MNTNVESFLLVFLFTLINCFVPRDHQQTTFIMLNRFFLLSKTPHPPFLTDNIKLDGIPIKLNEKYMPLSHCISSFERTSYKKLQDKAASSLVSCCFTSADIIF